MKEEVRMQNQISIEIPKKVSFILETIRRVDKEAFVVGGCVRDSILHRKPEDWDITTSANPELVKALFKHTIDTGLKHGTVTVMVEGEGFEVTTYRIDGKYEDGRHPSEVIFTPSLEEDLKRRDFTINAMAYSDRTGIVDLFGGLEDIKRSVIRCVGDARERFQEDALRMMRAVRFSAQLGYEIEEKTKEAIKELAPNLKMISAERIQTELVKTVISDHPDYLREAYKLGMTKVFMPEFDKTMETPQNHPHHQYSVGEHILHSMLEIPPRKELRLAMLFHDIGKPEVLEIDEEGITHFHGHETVSAEISKAVMKRLKFDNDTIDRVSRLVYWHGYGTEADEKYVRRRMNQIGEDIFDDYLLAKRADTLAQSLFQRKEKLERQEAFKDIYLQILEKKQCVSLKDLAVSGRDLIEIGIAPGRHMGEILNELLDEVLDDPECNKREYLIKRAKEL